MLSRDRASLVEERGGTGEVCAGGQKELNHIYASVSVAMYQYCTSL